MKKTQIQLKLLAVGITQKQIAAKLGFCQCAVLSTVRYERHNQIVQDEIARLLGESPAELWGKHYGPIWRKSRKTTTAQENGTGCLDEKQ